MKFESLFLSLVAITFALGVSGFISKAKSAEKPTTRIGTTEIVPLTKRVAIYWIAETETDVTRISYTVKLTDGKQYFCSTDSSLQPDQLIRIELDDFFACELTIPVKENIVSIQGDRIVRKDGKETTIAFTKYENVGGSTYFQNKRLQQIVELR